MSMDIIENSLDGRGLKIGIVQSRFNEYAGEGLLKACLAELDRLGVVEEDITLMRVPGALEIPFALQQLAATEEYDALIAIGAVIRGETYHLKLFPMNRPPASCRLVWILISRLQTPCSPPKTMSKLKPACNKRAQMLRRLPLRWPIFVKNLSTTWKMGSNQ